MSKPRLLFTGTPRCALIIFLLAAGPAPALSQSVANAARAQNKMGAAVNCSAPQTQYEINVCTERDYERAETELSALCKKLQKRLSAPDAQRLKGVQDIWLLYRKRECALVHDLYEGGSAQSAETAGCLARVTKARIGDLQADYQF
jgi:uncharacterized protein YecT (DUF1311 family)